MNKCSCSHCIGVRYQWVTITVLTFTNLSITIVAYTSVLDFRPPCYFWLELFPFDLHRFIAPTVCARHRSDVVINRSNFIYNIVLGLTALPLRRRQMTVMASRNTGESSVCSTLCLDRQHRNIKGPCFCTFVGESTGQRDSNAENVSIWWRHNERRPAAIPQCL